MASTILSRILTRISTLANCAFHQPLPIFLAVQAVLLLANPGLFPPWGDEYGTLRVSALPIGELFQELLHDYHPPLYYLLVHSWLKIPWPASPLVMTRVLSALFALLSTLVLDRIWLRNLDRSTRLWFLALWALSPCLVLYGRMARPYSLQLLLGTLAIYAGWRLVEDPGNRRQFAGYVVAAVCLLYVHYAPGLAVIVGISIGLLAKLVYRRDKRAFAVLLVGNTSIAVAYLPWWHHLTTSVQKTSINHPYHATPAAFLDHVVRAAYCFVSFTLGESLPVWGIIIGGCLSPLVLWLAWKALRPPPGWFYAVAAVAAVGYVGVSSWVSFAFVPARLLFLLPFYFLLLVSGRRRSPRIGGILCTGLLILSAGSLASYYRKEDFLNKGYLIPHEEIAATISSAPAGVEPILILDAANTDLHTLRKLPIFKTQIVATKRHEWSEDFRNAMRGWKGDTIWTARNTYDRSREGLIEKTEERLSKTYRVRKWLFVPYSKTDRLLMRLLGWPVQPTHVIQLMELRKR